MLKKVSSSKKVKILPIIVVLQVATWKNIIFDCRGKKQRFFSYFYHGIIFCSAAVFGSTFNFNFAWGFLSWISTFVSMSWPSIAYVTSMWSIFYFSLVLIINQIIKTDILVFCTFLLEYLILVLDDNLGEESEYFSNSRNSALIQLQPLDFLPISAWCCL